MYNALCLIRVGGHGRDRERQRETWKDKLSHTDREGERGEEERGRRKTPGLQVHGATTLSRKDFLNIAFSLYHKFVNVNLVTIVHR